MKYLKIILYVLLGISVLSIVPIFFASTPEAVDVAVGLMIGWAYVLFGLSIAMVIILPLINLVQSPKSAMRTLLGLGIVVVVTVICYFFSSDAPLLLSDRKTVIDDAFTLRMTDTMLYVTYAAFFAAIVIAIAGQIRSALK